MRISDWSSDVCSSDLLTCGVLHEFRVLERRRADHHTRYTQVKPALHGGPFTDAPAKLHMTGKSFDDALHRSGIHRPSCKGAIQIDDVQETGSSFGEQRRLLRRIVTIDGGPIHIALGQAHHLPPRSEEPTSELQSLMPNPY